MIAVVVDDLADVVEDVVALGTSMLFIIVSFDGLFASCCNDDKPNNNASTGISAPSASPREEDDDESSSGRVI